MHYPLIEHLNREEGWKTVAALGVGGVGDRPRPRDLNFHEKY